MENKLEQLLNSLIEKGWRPFNKDIREFFTLNEFTCGYRGEGTNHLGTIRAIVSKESGLWQFVCENGMYKKEALGLIFNDERTKNVFYKIDQFDEEGDVIQTGDMGGDEFIHISEPEYRLIESSLKDESELEQFLLDNIKVEG